MSVPPSLSRLAQQHTLLPIAILVIVTTVVARAGALEDAVGLTSLRAELGVAIPTGAGVGVSQIEANGGSGLSYMPDTTSSDFAGKTITAKSGASAVSGHASTVGFFYYGINNSLSPGVSTVDVYNADYWISNDPTRGILKTGSSSPPASETRKVQNHSWIGSFGGDGSTDIEALRRFDYSIEHDNFVAAVGLNNGSGSGVPALLANAYNALSVGLTNGQHSTGVSSVDGAGRVKPEIVAPQSATSYATPLVGSAAAMLRQTAPAAGQRSVTLKAMLLAGATKDQFDGWNKTATRPMDAHFGAGQLNIFQSYHIMAAGQQPANDGISVSNIGWDYNFTTAAGRSYFFDIPAGNNATRLSAVLTWNRIITATNWRNISASLSDLSLRIYNATGFTKGNLVDQSISSVDNIEHLYETILPPGRYALEVTGTQNNINFGIAWTTVSNVSIAATSPDAAESGPAPGTFTVTRSGNLSNPLVVSYTVGGTASAGADYAGLPATVTIPANVASASITVTPLADSIAEGDETVTVTLASGLAATYAEANAAVVIHDLPVDAWRFSHFGASELADPTASGDLADFDHDGMPNLVEYALGFDPKTPNANALPTAVVNPSGYPQLTYTKDAGALGVTCLVEISNDLVTWNPIDTVATAAVASPATTASSPSTVSAQPLQFMRLRVTRQ